MEINGHDVAFGKPYKKCWIGGSYSRGATHYSKMLQDWEIPSLKLYGYVRVDGRTLTEIQERIQREVNFDLEQRQKRKLGLQESTYGDCCR